MTITIRTATSKDADAIGYVHVKCWHETYTGIVPQDYLDQLSIEKRQKIWREMINKGQTIFVAVNNNKVVGFADGGKNRFSEINAAGELYAIYLLADYQKKGVGKRLFHAAEENLLSKGLTPFITWVLEKNPTCGFYQKMQGRIIEDKLEDIGDITFKEVAYIWRD